MDSSFFNSFFSLRAREVFTEQSEQSQTPAAALLRVSVQRCATRAKCELELATGLTYRYELRRIKMVGSVPEGAIH